MARATLDDNALHPAIRQRVSDSNRDLIEQVQAAMAAHAVVVLGMSGNPFVARARKALDAAGVVHHDIDVGSYFSHWRRRNALKMWSGWPTFPMVIVRGSLIGGADDLRRLIEAGELPTLLKP